MSFFGDLVGAAGNLVGGFLGRDASRQALATNIRYQDRYAKNAIQWKVNDAKKAGIHPLFALGAQTNSFSPVSVGDGGVSQFAAAGQNLGRAISAAANQDERVLQRKAMEVDIEGKELDNDIRRTELASKLRLSGLAGPPMQNPQFTDYTVGGKRIRVNRNFSDANVIQQRYGDVAEDAYGIGVVAPADLYSQLQRVYVGSPLQRAVTAADNYLRRGGDDLVRILKGYYSTHQPY